jgi:hypothetical protein
MILTSKAGLVALTKSMAAEWASQGPWFVWGAKFAHKSHHGPRGALENCIGRMAEQVVLTAEARIPSDRR